LGTAPSSSQLSGNKGVKISFRASALSDLLLFCHSKPNFCVCPAEASTAPRFNFLMGSQGLALFSSTP